VREEGYIMAFDYKKESMLKGVYGPNAVGHTYRPAEYHSIKAKKRKGKTRWAHPATAEYHVFNLADEHDGQPTEDETIDIRWVNDDGAGLYSLVDDCRVVLGKDNEERFAFFPTPMNDNDPWHGYPLDGSNIGEKLIEYWHKKKVISDSTYLRLSRHQPI